MNKTEKIIAVIGGVTYLGMTLQGFSHSKETPIKATVPVFAHVSLSTGTTAITQMQVPVNQALPERIINPFSFMEIAMNDRPLNSF